MLPKFHEFNNISSLYISGKKEKDQYKEWVQIDWGKEKDFAYYPLENIQQGWGAFQQLVKNSKHACKREYEKMVFQETSELPQLHDLDYDIQAIDEETNQDKEEEAGEGEGAGEEAGGEAEEEEDDEPEAVICDQKWFSEDNIRDRREKARKRKKDVEKQIASLLELKESNSLESLGLGRHRKKEIGDEKRKKIRKIRIEEEEEDLEEQKKEEEENDEPARKKVKTDEGVTKPRASKRYCQAEECLVKSKTGKERRRISQEKHGLKISFHCQHTFHTHCCHLICIFCKKDGRPFDFTKIEEGWKNK